MNYEENVFERLARTHDLERLQQEKNTLTAQLRGGDHSLLATADAV